MPRSIVLKPGHCSGGGATQFAGSNSRNCALSVAMPYCTAAVTRPVLGRSAVGWLSELAAQIDRGPVGIAFSKGFATFGIFSGHKYSDETQPTSRRDHADHSRFSRFVVDG
jgi:hypothetical protein